MKALVLDCGGVLSRPENGDWAIPRELEPLLRPFSEADILMAKHRSAAEWLNESQKMSSLAEEDMQRLGFLRAVMNDLGVYVDSETLAECARRVTYGSDRYVLYGDVRPYLEWWKGKYRLGLLSDAMPSMKIAMEYHGILSLFDAAFASCEVGATKPAPQMYRAVLEALNVAPEDALFVDDLPRNLRGAQAVGMRAVRMARDVYVTLRPWEMREEWDGETVTSFAELDGLLA